MFTFFSLSNHWMEPDCGITALGNLRRYSSFFGNQIHVDIVGFLGISDILLEIRFDLSINMQKIQKLEKKTSEQHGIFKNWAAEIWPKWVARLLI